MVAKDLTNKLPRLDVLTVAAAALLMSSVYVVVMTRSGTWIAEDPTFQNGSYLLDHLFVQTGPNQIGLLTEGFRSLVFPYGVISAATEIFTESSLTHFRVQLFAHVLVTVLALFYIYQSFVRRYLAFILVLLTISTQAFYEQVLYSIGASQVVLLMVFIISFGTQVIPSVKRTFVVSIVAFLLSIPLWSNLPQLIATWLAGSALFLFRLFGSLKAPNSVLRIYGVIVLIAMIIWAPFLLETLSQKDDFLKAAAAIAPAEFRNAGPSIVLQGFGKWSLIDTNWQVPRYLSDLNPARQLIRLLIPITICGYALRTILRSGLKTPLAQISVCIPASVLFVWASRAFMVPPLLLISVGSVLFVWSVTFFRLERQNESEIESKFDPFFAIFLATQLAFFLSVIGAWDWYWRLRREFVVLSGFREPWAKFSQIYVVLLMCCFGIVVNQLWSKIGRRHRLMITYPTWSLSIVCALFLLIPMSLSGTQRHLGLDKLFTAPSSAEWARADSLLSYTQRFVSHSEICIVNFDPRGLLTGLLRTKYPLTSQVGKSCETLATSVKFVTRNYKQALGDQTSLIVYHQECLLFSSSELTVIADGCIATVNFDAQTVVVGVFVPNAIR